jgi:hypothetical protein
MKTFTFNLFLTAGLVLLMACEEDISSVRPPAISTDAYLTGKTPVQSIYFTLRFDLSDKKDGTYRIGKSPYTGSAVSVRIKKGRVAGFQVFRKDGSLVQPNGTSQAPPSQDHSKDPQIICKEGVEIYYDPEYGYLFKQHGNCDITSSIIEVVIDSRY